MSAEKNIITQSEIGPIKTEESELAENLYAHANASLSKAHGMEFMYLPYPFNDAYGNEVGRYYDSAGDIVGYYQMRLTYSNTNYYVPLVSSMLAGQTALKGVRTSSGISNETGDSAWVTDFTNEAIATLSTANTAMLLPHAQLSHWETHAGGVFSILPANVTDSAGHVVGNYVARFIFDGRELLIPCDPRLGGPAQLARNVYLTIDTWRVSIPKGKANTCDVNAYAYATGTKPIIYTWQWSITDLPPWTSFTTGYVYITGWNPGFDCLIFENHLNIIYVNPGSGDTASVYLRCEINQPGLGTTYTNSVMFTAHDNTGSWIVYAAHEVAPFTREEMRRLYHLRLWSLKHHPEVTNLYMGRTGNQLVARMKKKHFDFTTLTAEIKGFLSKDVSPEARFQRFQKMVVRCFAEHWPDCPHPLVKNHLGA